MQKTGLKNGNIFVIRICKWICLFNSSYLDARVLKWAKILIIISERNKKNDVTFLRFIYDTIILNVLETKPKKLYSLLSDIFFGIIYSAYQNHPLSVYIIRPGTPYTSILLSPSGEGSSQRVDVYKKPGVEETKKGREERGRGRRDSRLNQRAKYKKGRRWKIEGNEALCEKAAVAARYRSLASHSTLRIRDIMLEC